MYLDKAKKEEIFGQYGKSATDTGSAEAQIALFPSANIFLGFAEGSLEPFCNICV